jgi:hypothetical protein
MDRDLKAYALFAIHPLSITLDDFGHCHAKPILDENDFASRDETVIDEDIDGFADLAIEFNNSAGGDLEKISHTHPGIAKNGGDNNRNIKDLFQINRGFGTGRLILPVEGNFLAVIEARQGYVGIGHE